jgi:CheY-like chemotaxis protein
MPQANVLMVGRDPSLAKPRSEVLRAAGYSVVVLVSPELAVKQFLMGDFDLVILCHSIPAEKRQFLCKGIRQHTSRTPIVYLAPKPGEQDPFVDATVVNDPTELLAGLREILHGNGSHWRMSRSRKSDAAGKNDAQETILFVDDDPAVLDSWSALLQRAGYRVLPALDGAEALRLISSEAVDAVVMDYEMPGMNGGTIATHIRQIKSAVPLILLSGLLTVPEKELALFNRFVPKGDSVAALLAAIEEALTSHAN